jgi:MFS family permease
MDRASGKRHGQPSGFAVLLHNRQLMIFAVVVFAFHFANAAMLPLVGQELALHNKEVGTALMSACIVAAQVVMVPVAYIVGARADTWGRKPIFLVGFAVLTVRAFLYPLSDNSYWLVGVQLLDGVGAGIFGALFPIVVQDVTHGTGRFNVSLGAITTAWGVGAALSNFVAGGIVVAAGYGAAFMALGAIAAAGLALYLIAMPETLSGSVSRPGVFAPPHRRHV